MVMAYLTQELSKINVSLRTRLKLFQNPDLNEENESEVKELVTETKTYYELADIDRQL